MPGRSITTARAATATLGGINVEPSARPWRYLGANPDSWWCPTAAQCSNGADPLARINTEMALAQQLYVSNIRLEIPWFLVEPGNGSYDWARTDYIFNSASRHGQTIQPILVYTPSWDGAYNSFPHPGSFGAFVTAFMNRYGTAISTIEMWNEPDGGQSLTVNDPNSYVADILIPGYNAVKRVRPSVQVIEGGSINDSGTCCAWLSGIYNAGGGSYFDIAAFHDYGGNYAQIAQQYQAVINAHRSLGNKPIWLGEYGVSDANGSQQSSLINGALANTAALAMAQYYTLRDESVYTCCPPAPTGEHKQYGVFAADDVTKKSSFYTMVSLLKGFTPPRPVPPPVAAPGPSPTPPPASPSPKHSPGPGTRPGTGATGGAGGPSGSGSGLSGSSDTALRTAAVNRGRAVPQVLFLVILLIGLVVFGLGLVITTTLGATLTKMIPAGINPKLLQSIQGNRWSLGIGVATGGAVLCLAAVLLVILPQH
jgi:hypothetical protein